MKKFILFPIFFIKDAKRMLSNKKLPYYIRSVIAESVIMIIGLSLILIYIFGRIFYSLIKMLLVVSIFLIPFGCMRQGHTHVHHFKYTALPQCYMGDGMYCAVAHGVLDTCVCGAKPTFENMYGGKATKLNYSGFNSDTIIVDSVGLEMYCDSSEYGFDFPYSYDSMGTIDIFYFDSLGYLIDTPRYWLNTIDTAHDYNYDYSHRSEVSIDTLPVLMLIVDTFHGMVPNGMMSFTSDSTGGFKLKADSSYRRQSADVWYINGYEVRLNEYRYKDVSVDPNYQMAGGGWTLMGQVPNYQKYLYRSSHVEYLSSKNEPLPKNIVVWQTKEIPK